VPEARLWKEVKSKQQKTEENRIYVAKWAKANPERYRARMLWNKARVRAEQRKIPFTVTQRWLEMKLSAGHCEATGLRFDMEFGNGRRPFTPSIDQKIAGLGYTPENTQLVIYLYNLAKSDWGDDELQHCLRVIGEALLHRVFE
jgi:hypothetical protein